MLDAFDDNTMTTSLRNIELVGREILAVLADSNRCNNNNNVVAPLRQLAAAYVGIKLTNESHHFDAEGTDANGFSQRICGGTPKQWNVEYVSNFAKSWANDMLSNAKTSGYYPSAPGTPPVALKPNDGELIK